MAPRRRAAAAKSLDRPALAENGRIFRRLALREGRGAIKMLEALNWKTKLRSIGSREPRRARSGDGVGAWRRRRGVRIMG